jgi:branched-chain amino acid transport system substrate-binding protein
MLKGKSNVRVKNRIVGKEFGTILAVALTALLLLTACAPAPTVEGKKVEVAAIWGMTGPAAASLQIQTAAIQDYFRYFNEQEAIPGVSIDLSWGDDMLQSPLLYSHYERFVEGGIPLIFMEEATGLTGLKDRFEKDEVVIVAPGSGYQEVAYPPGWRYGTTPTIAEQAAAVFEYFRENWKEERSPRLALVGIESPWGYEPRYAIEYAQSLGFEVLPPEIVPFVTLDATTQLIRLSGEGADLVYIQGLPTATGPVLKDAERLGLLGQMQFAGHQSGMGERVIQMTGAASEGYLMPRPFPWFDEIEIPGIKLMLDTQMKYHGKVTREGECFFSWVSAPVVCEAIKRAIENVGYENLDGSALKEAMDSIKDFDVYGLATVTYKPDDHRGVTKVAIYQVREGKIVRISDWQEAPVLVSEE